MKVLNFFLFFSFALIFIQCKEKTVQKNTSNNEPDKEMSGTKDGDTISVIVYDTKNSPMNDVQIEIQTGGVTTGHDRTNADGEATLMRVASEKKYTFIKQGFTSQLIQFNNYENIKKLHVHMKPKMSHTPPSMNINGHIFDSSGNAIDSVIVRSNDRITISQSGGFYSFNIISADGIFPLNFEKGSVNGGLSMNINEDTVIVDVFIDGFTPETDPVK